MKRMNPKPPNKHFLPPSKTPFYDAQNRPIEIITNAVLSFNSLGPRD